MPWPHVKVPDSAIPAPSALKNLRFVRRSTILLADDHAIVTDGLFSLLKERFDVVGAVANGNDLVAEAT